MKDLLKELLESRMREGNRLFNPNVPRKTEGFDSLISEKEYEAIQHLIHAFDNYVKVHNDCAVEMNDKFKQATPYQRIQYVMYSSMGSDLIEHLDRLQDIYTLDKEVIDKWCEDDEVSVEDLEMKIHKSLFVEKLLKAFS